MAQQTTVRFIDDLDGSVVEYKITHDADGYGTPDTMTRALVSSGRSLSEASMPTKELTPASPPAK